MSTRSKFLEGLQSGAGAIATMPLLGVSARPLGGMPIQPQPKPTPKPLPPRVGNVYGIVNTNHVGIRSVLSTNQALPAIDSYGAHTSGTLSAGAITVRGFGQTAMVITTAHPLWSGAQFTVGTTTYYPNFALGMCRFVDTKHGGGATWITPDGTRHSQYFGYGTKTIQTVRRYPLQGGNMIPRTAAGQAASLHNAVHAFNILAILAGLTALAGPEVAPFSIIGAAAMQAEAESAAIAAEQLAPNNSAFSTVQDILSEGGSQYLASSGDSAPDGGGSGSPADQPLEC